MRCYLILYNCHSCYLPFYFNLLDLLPFFFFKRFHLKIGVPPCSLPLSCSLFWGGFSERQGEGSSCLHLPNASALQMTLSEAPTHPTFHQQGNAKPHSSKQGIFLTQHSHGKTESRSSLTVATAVAVPGSGYIDLSSGNVKPLLLERHKKTYKSCR